ncbi:MAG: MerR family transcriptional regulator [Trueperaceae bacterium]|nr:MerR family transcriptional regulator [Trueperaceae bacterium]
MLRIGSFAHFAQISVVTLRHYDQIGLLKPMKIDEATGYRLYSAKQIYEVKRILALKDLGLSLEQIKEILVEGISPEQLHCMLMLRQLEEQHNSVCTNLKNA